MTNNLIQFPTRTTDKHTTHTDDAQTTVTPDALDAIAEAGEHVDRLVELFNTRSAEKGHEQALCDLTGLGLATGVLRTNALAILMVAIGRLATGGPGAHSSDTATPTPAERIGAPSNEDELPHDSAETMTVTVRDRASESPWGSGLTNPITKKITISAFCRTCGGRRGQPRGLNSCDDGAFYWVQVWDNPCGHVDHYADVLNEALEATGRPAVSSRADTDGAAPLSATSV